MNDQVIIVKNKRSKDSIIYRNFVYNWNQTNKSKVYFKCKTMVEKHHSQWTKI